MKVKPVTKVLPKLYTPKRKTPEEHTEAHKDVGKLAKWKEFWPSIDPVTAHEWTGIIIGYVDTYHGTYHIYRNDGELEMVAGHRVSFFTA